MPRERSDDFLPSAAESVVMDNFGEDFQASLDAQNDADGMGSDDGDGDNGERQQQRQRKPVAFDNESEGDDEDVGDSGYSADDEGDDDLGDNVLRMPRRDARDELDDMRRNADDEQRRPIPKGAEVKADRNGNLVDKNGKVVARAGAQARFYKNMRKAQGESATYAQQVQDTQGRLQQAVNIGRELHTELTELKAQQKAVKDFGFSPKDQISAMQLFSDFRQDPEGTIRKILTRMAANGKTVRGMNDTGGFDTKALMDTIQETVRRETAPIRERAEAERRAYAARQQQEQGLNETRREVSRFFNRNPDAGRYIGTFQRLMKDPRYAEMSLGEIWLHIKENRRQPSNRRQTLQERRSLPRGRGNPPSGNRGTPIASLDQTYDSIINGILDEQGYQRAV